MNAVIVTPAFAHYPTDWHFSPGIDTGEFVFFSGVTGTRPDGSISEDPESQCRDAWNYLRANLILAGLQWHHLIDITTYHVDLRRHLNVFMKVKDEFIVEPFPAWTAVGVAELITEGAVVEIRAIARRGADSR